MVLPDTEATKLCSPLAKKKICSKSPVPGALQQHLFYGEYSPFKYAPIFESDFIQVTKRGEVLSIHKDITMVTVGVTSTSPSFFLPNVMLLARPINSLREMVCNCRISTDRCPMELTRLFPLCFVNISIHDVYNRQLRLKLANGRAFYLQLYVHPDCENEVFERWMKLVALLRNSPENVYGYEAVTPEIECILEQTSVETLATELSDWQLEEPAMSPAMREYYEANRASSRKSARSREPEDCSTRTQSRSRKSDSGKAGENVGEAENFPDFSQEHEPWPPVKPPERKKKTQGPIGFNFFKKDKGSKEKSPEEDKGPGPEPGPGPVTTPTEDYEEEQKMEGEESEEKDDRKRSDKDKGRQKEKSKDKEVKQRDKDKKEKMEKQMEREQELKEKEEKRQQEKGKKKGREDKGGTDKGSKQQAIEEKQRAKEEKQRAKEAKQREEKEKKQRAREEKKKRSQQKDKAKQVKIKGDEEKDMN